MDFWNDKKGKTPSGKPFTPATAVHSPWDWELSDSLGTSQRWMVPSYARPFNYLHTKSMHAIKKMYPRAHGKMDIFLQMCPQAKTHK